jgi:hypothetical protein
MQHDLPIPATGGNLLEIGQEFAETAFPSPGIHDGPKQQPERVDIPPRAFVT